MVGTAARVHTRDLKREIDHVDASGHDAAITTDLTYYHHIKSKGALFVELHNAAPDTAAERIEEAVAKAKDPWSRPEATCVTLPATTEPVPALRLQSPKRP